MSKKHAAINGQWVCLLTIFIAITFIHRGAAQENSLPPIVGVTITDQKSVVTHRGNVRSGPVQVRVNVPDVRSTEFQHDLKRLEQLNCTIAPVTSGPLSSALRFYPRVAKLSGSDLEFHRDELIKAAIVKKITVTRAVAQAVCEGKTQVPAGEVHPHKPSGRFICPLMER